MILAIQILWLIAATGWAGALVCWVKLCYARADADAEQCRIEALQTEIAILKQQRDSLLKKHGGRT